MPPDRSLSNRTCFTVNLRDRLACTQCGRTPEAKENYHRGFEYHHVIPRSAGGGDAVENIVLLCHDCHKRQHGKEVPAAIASDSAPAAFSCKACATSLDPETVEMNCGWYRCGTCQTQVHLFDHFFL